MWLRGVGKNVRGLLLKYEFDERESEGTDCGTDWDCEAPSFDHILSDAPMNGVDSFGCTDSHD